jgi:hypothetical protein
MEALILASDARRRNWPTPGRARVVSVQSRPREPSFFMDDDPAKGNAAIVTLGEMKNSERFHFVADGAEPLA